MARREIAIAITAVCSVAGIGAVGPSTAAASEFVVTIRGWRTTIERPLSGREPGWPVTVVALDRPSPQIPYVVGPRATEAQRLEGLASFYWQDQMTANGERFNPADFTAAHLTLPFGTRVRVTNAVNGQSVVVRINDRGPFKAGRIIDLSQAAGHALGMAQIGVVPVRLSIVP